MHLGLEVPFIGLQDALLVLEILLELLMSANVLLMLHLELPQRPRCLLENLKEAVNECLDALGALHVLLGERARERNVRGYDLLADFRDLSTDIVDLFRQRLHILLVLLDLELKLFNALIHIK